jgi:hypothetical protein
VLPNLIEQTQATHGVSLNLINPISPPSHHDCRLRGESESTSDAGLAGHATAQIGKVACCFDAYRSLSRSDSPACGWQRGRRLRLLTSSKPNSATVTVAVDRT